MRNVANLAPPFEAGAGYHGVSAAIEFAVVQLKVETILVLGHAQCAGRVRPQRPCTGPGLLSRPRRFGLLDHAKSRVQGLPGDPNDALEHESIRVTLENLATFPFVQKAINESGLQLRGARYGVADGSLELLDPETGAFHLLV